ncbi:MAG: ABC transporter permease [Roseococcus sp.]|nr:ABC transporter permease [Roseococcus sp.]
MSDASLARLPAAPRFDAARWANVLLPLLLLLGVVGVWWGSVALFAIPEYLLPAPDAVARRIVTDAELLARHAKSTITVVLLGFALSTVLGVALALSVVLNRTVERTLMPIIVGSQTIPKVAIAPLFIVWLGFGMEPKIAVTFLISFFPVVVSSVAGLKAVESDMLDLVRSMGAGSAKSIIKVRIPTALPSIFAGLKIAICSAVVGAIVAEFVGSDSGLGYLLLTSTATLDGTLTWAALMILVATGITLFVSVVQLERFLIPWHVSIRTER